MMAFFVAALIDFGISTASCSAIAQSSDDSNFFKATKCVLKGVMDYGNASLEKKMREYLQTRLKLTGEQRFSSEKKNLMVMGLMKCVYAIKKVLTEDIIKDGYRRIGQFPVDFDQAMSRCKMSKQIFTLPIMRAFREALPLGVESFRTTGSISEAQMDLWGLICVPCLNTTPKDQRVLHQQRSVIMNSVDCIEKYAAYRQRRIDAPVIAAAARVAAIERRQVKAQ